MKRTVKADRFFTGEELAKIKAATQSVEARTIGEVAVMVVDSSDRYHESEVLGGIFLGSLVSFIITVSFFHSSVWTYVPLSFAFFFPAKYLFQKIPLLKAAFIGVKRKEYAVMQRALRAFYEKGLYKTKQNTGVLFFLSLLERKVWVLADKGIYEKIDQETLNKFASVVSDGIRNGRAGDALCEAITMSGDLLARHFPMAPGDVNELPDEVLTDD
jgi:putative membrane protein